MSVSKAFDILSWIAGIGYGISLNKAIWVFKVYWNTLKHSKDNEMMHSIDEWHEYKIVNKTNKRNKIVLAHIILSDFSFILFISCPQFKRVQKSWIS